MGPMGPSSPALKPAFRVPHAAFIALDGPDGSGKTTQVGHLISWLHRHGIEAVACRDPGGSALGDRLRSILLDRHDVPIGLRAEMLLYMASRAQLVEEVIRPALEAGKVVVSDRFLLANVVYQGHAGGLAVEDVWQVGRVATGGLMPDLTIVLDVAPDVARSRTGGPRDRIEDRPEAFRADVRRGFLHAVETYPAPIAVVAGDGPEDEVAERIQHEVARALGQHPRT